jgi:hypothetical protein
MTMTGQALGSRTSKRSGQKRMATFVLMVLAVVGLTGIVMAANRFAVVGVENATHVTIRMEHKWGGGGSWNRDVLQPGGKKWFWHTYDHANENRSPKFHVRFDSDLNPGKLFNINYDLKKNAAAAHEWDNARKYVFRYDGNRKYIDLYER